MIYDYFIIGQGLAGSLLSYFLLKENKKVLVIDSGKTNASMVAGGMFNPITGRKMHTAWKAEEIFPFAQISYQALEQLLQMRFYYEMPMLKLFKDIEEKTLAFSQSEKNNTNRFITDTEMGHVPGLKNLLAMKVNGTGWLDTHTFLTKYRSYLSATNALKSAFFNFDLLKGNDDDGYEYLGLKTEKIIFCDGYFGMNNPFFSWLPWKPAKGEILTLKIPGLSSKYIFNRNIYLIPLGKETFRLGATYSWDALDNKTTEEGAKELLDKLKQIIDVEYEIVSHDAEVRPASKDRRPFIGMHPEKKNMGILNGLGTKGVILAPYFAQQFTQHLLTGEKIDKEADIKRFISQ